MKVRFSRLFFVTLLATVFLSPPAGRADPRRQDPPEMGAYMDLVRANAARDAGLWVEALHTYTSALEKFTVLSRAHPDILPNSVARRIKYCRTEIELIRTRLASQTDAVREEAEREIEQLRARIWDLEVRLEAAEQREQE